MRKGDWVQFRSNWGERPILHRLGRITRVAKNGSWVDVEGFQIQTKTCVWFGMMK